MFVKSYYIIKPNSTPSDIKFTFLGSDSVYVNNNGELVIETNLGDIILPQPNAYQIDSNGNKVNLSWQAVYTITGSNVSFSIGTYNSSLSLVLEINNVPTPQTNPPEGNVRYCTSWGTGRQEIINDITINKVTNYTYLIGYTNTSSLLVSPGCYLYAGQPDAYIVSLMPNTDILFETYYGGTGMEYGTCIAVQKDVQNNTSYIFIAGSTYSTDIPHLQVMSTNGSGNNSYLDDNLGGNNDIFIARLHRDGVCDWSTYYGGDIDSLNYHEQAWDMVVTYDIFNKLELYIVGNGNIHTPLVTPPGWTPTSNKFYDNSLESFGLILKFDFTLNPIWVTRFPSSQIYGIDAYRYSNGVPTISITGSTNNANLDIESPDTNFPNTSINQGNDAFVTSFSSAYTIYLSEYIGGSGNDFGKSISINEDYVVITGFTKSNNFLCKRQQPYISNDFYVDYLTSQNLGDAFITKISRINNSPIQIGDIIWSTYYGGGSYDIGYSIDMDDDANLVIFGLTNSGGNTLTIPHPNQNPVGMFNHTDKFGNDEYDDFIAYFSNYTRLIWATYFGSDPDDLARVCKINDNDLWIAGAHFWNPSYSSNYTTLPFWEDPNGTTNFDFFKYNATFSSIYNWSNGFIARLILPEIPPITSIQEIEENEVLVFPNPANDFINIKSSEDFNIERIEIYSTTSSLVSELYINNKTNKSKIEISSLQQGVYYVLVYSDKGKLFSKRIVKIKN